MVQTSTKLKMNQNYILPRIFSWKLILTNYHPIIHCYALLKLWRCYGEMVNLVEGPNMHMTIVVQIA
jgi:hypothetical protein